MGQTGEQREAMALTTPAVRRRAPTKIFLTLPRKVLQEKPGIGLGKFYSRLDLELRMLGADVTMLPLSRQPHKRKGNRTKLIFLHNGAAEEPNVLNTALAYADPYWHVDPKGVLGLSSAGDVPFVHADVDKAQAAGFFRALRRDFVKTRSSRYYQAREKLPVPEGAIAVFMQGDTGLTRRTMRPGSERMIRAVAEGAGGRPIVVKHHPLNTNPRDVEEVATLRAEGVNICEVAANVHDILEQCVATVSVSSACGFEGFLHRKPAIFFGKSDLIGFAQSAHDGPSFAAALEEALTGSRSYMRFVYWYLTTHCVSLHSETFIQEILRRAAAIGFDADRLGLDKKAVAALSDPKAV
ncbi:MAG: hypothetical protein AAGK28_14660 [Pseudomonadota bacterium]